MRRHVVRLALAIVATSMLAACADVPTGPSAPEVRRADTTTPPPPLSACGTGTQGSQTC